MTRNMEAKTATGAQPIRHRYTIDGGAIVEKTIKEGQVFRDEEFIGDAYLSDGTALDVVLLAWIQLVAYRRNIFSHTTSKLTEAQQKDTCFNCE